MQSSQFSITQTVCWKMPHLPNPVQSKEESAPKHVFGLARPPLPMCPASQPPYLCIAGRRTFP